MTTHGNEFDELLNDALDGRLDAAAQAAFHERLEADPELAREWEHRRVLRETLLGLGSEPAPEGFADRLGFLLREQPAQDPAPVAPPAEGGGFGAWLAAPWRNAGAWRSVAALLLIGVVGYTLWSHQRASSGTPETARTSEAMPGVEPTKIDSGNEGASLSRAPSNKADFELEKAGPGSFAGANPGEKAPFTDPMRAPRTLSADAIRFTTIDPALRKLAQNLELADQQEVYFATYAEHGQSGRWDGSVKSETPPPVATNSAWLFHSQVPVDLAANLAANTLILPRDTARRIQVIATAPPAQRLVTGAAVELSERAGSKDVLNDGKAAKTIDRLSEKVKEAKRLAETKRVEGGRYTGPPRPDTPKVQKKRAGRGGVGGKHRETEDRGRDRAALKEQRRKNGRLMRLEGPGLLVTASGPLPTTDYLLTGARAHIRARAILADLRTGKGPAHFAAGFQVVSRSQTIETITVAGGGAVADQRSAGKAPAPPPVEWELFSGALTEAEIRKLVARLESEEGLRIRTLSPPVAPAPAPAPARGPSKQAGVSATPWDPDAVPAAPARRTIRLLAVAD